MRISFRNIAVGFLSGMLFLLLAATVRAQAGVLEEVIVTAQKRVENVQDIPVTIHDAGHISQQQQPSRIKRCCNGHDAAFVNIRNLRIEPRIKDSRFSAG